MANAKHWVVNSQETDRMTVNEMVDERTRMEYYYPPFAGATLLLQQMLSYRVPGDKTA